MSPIPSKKDVSDLRVQSADAASAKAVVEAEKIIAKAGDLMRQGATNGQTHVTIHTFYEGASQFDHEVYEIVRERLAAAGYQSSLGGWGLNDSREFIVVTL